MRRQTATLMALALLQFGTDPAIAQQTSAVHGLPVTGSTPQVCTLAGGELQTGQLVNFNGLSGDTLQVTQLLDQQTLAARPASASVSFEAACNYPHRIRIESQNNGLWPTDGRQVSDAPGFATALPYDASITWGIATGVLQTDARVRSSREQRINVDQATAGTVTLRLAILAGASNNGVNAPVLAGVYGDTLRITLEPR
ncbi:hypothetical protein [Novosphingobium taihuense]|uniref:Uncharacterized protein n=1 Tax=Novosphingobium taihuense TaxID=260085 RepID=A0A7W7ETN5_9SPHN|nr:hypothetical protein [Novosphingobium taihuense]MBB4613563.1 hypothetical protein [Novosphingobium taihuense]TWH81193.1 hypothetical protein IQ25_03580 [Novosphingobium taihuense]